MQLDVVGRHAGALQHRNPIDQLAGRRLLAQLALLAQPVELHQHLIEQLRLQVRMMHVDDLLHQRAVGELDEVEHAAAQERVRQFLLVVRGDDHDGPLLRDHLVARLGDREAHLVELAQQVIRELDVGFVDFVDQQHLALFALEGASHRAHADVGADVRDIALAETRVVETLHGVVDVEPFLRLGRGLDVPALDREAEALGDVLREQRLAGARLAFDQQRAFERDRAVHRIHERGRGDVPLRA